MIRGEVGLEVPSPPPAANVVSWLQLGVRGTCLELGRGLHRQRRLGYGCSIWPKRLEAAAQLPRRVSRPRQAATRVQVDLDAAPASLPALNSGGARAGRKFLLAFPPG